MADWMAFNVADYTANTLHLTTRQHGAYILLICAAWAGKGSLPGADGGLMAIAKLTPREWQADGDVIKAFLTRRGGIWVHERVEFEWNDAQSIIAAKSKAGKEGARRRWHGRANGPAMAQPSVCQSQTDAPLPSPLPEQEDMTGAKAPGRRRSKTDEQRTNLPPDFRPTEDDRHHALDNGGDPDASFPFFLDHYTEGKGRNEKRTLDGWHKRFRLWCTRDAQWKSPSRSGPGFRSPPDGGDVGAFARAATILGGGKLV